MMFSKEGSILPAGLRANHCEPKQLFSAARIAVWKLGRIAAAAAAGEADVQGNEEGKMDRDSERERIEARKNDNVE